MNRRIDMLLVALYYSFLLFVCLASALANESPETAVGLLFLLIALLVVWRWPKSSRGKLRVPR